MLSGLIEALACRVRQRAPYDAPAWARELMTGAVDLHADALLWGRDLLERGTRGHVDLPRLREGNVALQAFTVVTKTPHGLNVNREFAEVFEVYRVVA